MLLRFSKRFSHSRPEQYKLRQFLLQNSDPICIFVRKNSPKYVSRMCSYQASDFYHHRKNGTISIILIGCKEIATKYMTMVILV